MRNQQLVDGIDNLFRGLNSFTSLNDNDVIISAFRRQHRTLQQCFMRSVLLPILRHLAESYTVGAYDGRNEDSCRLAAKMLENVNESDTYLPYV